MTLSLTLSFCVETAFAQNAADENDPKWECYAPAPGHPTDAERVAFVDKASKIAVDLEKAMAFQHRRSLRWLRSNLATVGQG